MSRHLILALVLAVAGAGVMAHAASGLVEAPPLAAARGMFYNGRYADAAAAATELCTEDAATLSACELHTSALLFQLRRAIGDATDKEKAFKECASCAALFSEFVAETRRGQKIGRARLLVDPDDENALFFVGRLDLNYVWLQLGTLGRKTGWDEYWEARKSLDKVLKMNPENVRAKVARAWIDYIVDTKMPRGTRWLLGGGNKKKGLRAVREAATVEGDQFVRAEAAFALWDMQVREKDIAEALVTARALAADFPTNPDLQKFLDAHAVPTTR